VALFDARRVLLPFGRRLRRPEVGRAVGEVDVVVAGNELVLHDTLRRSSVEADIVRWSFRRPKPYLGPYSGGRSCSGSGPKRLSPSTPFWQSQITTTMP